MPQTVKVAVFGLGSTGQAITRLLLQTPSVKVVGVTDPAPASAGKDLGTVLGLPRRLRIKVDGTPERFIKKLRADAAFVCTSSILKEVKPQLLGLVARRVHVLTSCEELAFPVPPRVAAAREIDREARKRKVSVMAAGLNPGFAMDALALVLTAPCTGVRRVSVTRVQDAGTRRLPLQRRLGAGLNSGQFRRAVTEGTVRHVGLVESAHMIASSLGWKLDKVDETLEPAIAPRDLDTEYLRIAAGAAAGIRQSVRGYRKGELAVKLDLQVYVGAEAPRDHILIDAEPPVEATIAGGIAGEVATAALFVNALPRLLAAPPGLVNVRDLPLPHALNPHDMRPPSSPRRR
jgi:4-hydroxy-tetrahydrodipicolinate reductase